MGKVALTLGKQTVDYHWTNGIREEDTVRQGQCRCNLFSGPFPTIQNQELELVFSKLHFVKCAKC